MQKIYFRKQTHETLFQLVGIYLQVRVFKARKNMRYSPVMAKGEEIFPVEWSVKEALHLYLRCERSGSERVVPFVQYIKVTTPSDVDDQNFACICVRWSTSDDIYEFVCRKELEGGSIYVRM